MTCRCGHEFCWLCGEKLAEEEITTHYDSASLFGCSGLQFAELKGGTLARMAGRGWVMRLHVWAIRAAMAQTTLLFVVACSTVIHAFERREKERLAASAAKHKENAKKEGVLGKMRVAAAKAAHHHSRRQRGRTPSTQHKAQESALPAENDAELIDLADDMMAAFAEHYPHLAEFTAEHVMQPGYSFSDEFDYGLDLILDGLAHKVSDTLCGD